MDEVVIARIAKGALLVCSAPIWFPILKAIYHEVQSCLRLEGGLFGRKPTALELSRIHQKYGKYDDPLVSETLQTARARRRLPGSAGRQTATPPGARRDAGRGPVAQRRAF